MFEPVLKCNVLTDHLMPKCVLPLFEQYIDAARQKLDASVFLLMEQGMRKHFELSAYMEQKDKDATILLKSRLSTTEAELQQLRLQFSNVVAAKAAEHERHCREMARIREQLWQKKRFGDVYDADGLSAETLSAGQTSSASQAGQATKRAPLPAVKMVSMKRALEMVQTQKEVTLGLERRLAEREAALARAAAESAEKAAELPKLYSHIEDLKSELDQYKAKLSEMESSQGGALAELALAKEAAEQELARQRAKAKSLHKEVKTSRDMVAELYRRLDDIRGHTGSSTERNGVASKMSTELNTLETSLQSMQRELDMAMSEDSRLSQRVDDISREMQATQEGLQMRLREGPDLSDIERRIDGLSMESQGGGKRGDAKIGREGLDSGTLESIKEEDLAQAASRIQQDNERLSSEVERLERVNAQLLSVLGVTDPELIARIKGGDLSAIPRAEHLARVSPGKGPIHIPSDLTTDEIAQQFGHLFLQALLGDALGDFPPEQLETILNLPQATKAQIQHIVTKILAVSLVDPQELLRLERDDRARKEPHVSSVEANTEPFLESVDTILLESPRSPPPDQAAPPPGSRPRTGATPASVLSPAVSRGGPPNAEGQDDSAPSLSAIQSAATSCHDQDVPALQSGHTTSNLPTRECVPSKATPSELITRRLTSDSIEEIQCVLGLLGYTPRVVSEIVDSILVRGTGRSPLNTGLPPRHEDRQRGSPTINAREITGHSGPEEILEAFLNGQGWATVREGLASPLRQVAEGQVRILYDELVTHFGALQRVIELQKAREAAKDAMALSDAQVQAPGDLNDPGGHMVSITLSAKDKAWRAAWAASRQLGGAPTIKPHSYEIFEADDVFEKLYRNALELREKLKVRQAARLKVEMQLFQRYHEGLATSQTLRVQELPGELPVQPSDRPASGSGNVRPTQVAFGRSAQGSELKTPRAAHYEMDFSTSGTPDSLHLAPVSLSGRELQAQGSQGSTEMATGGETGLTLRPAAGGVVGALEVLGSSGEVGTPQMQAPLTGRLHRGSTYKRESLDPRPDGEVELGDLVRSTSSVLYEELPGGGLRTPRIQGAPKLTTMGLTKLPVPNAAVGPGGGDADRHTAAEGQRDMNTPVSARDSSRLRSRYSVSGEASGTSASLPRLPGVSGNGQGRQKSHDPTRDSLISSQPASSELQAGYDTFVSRTQTGPDFSLSVYGARPRMLDLHSPKNVGALAPLPGLGDSKASQDRNPGPSRAEEQGPASLQLPNAATAPASSADPRPMGHDRGGERVQRFPSDVSPQAYQVRTLQSSTSTPSEAGTSV